MLKFWRDVGDALIDARDQYWVKQNTGNAILLLELMIRRIETLIMAMKLEKKKRNE